ncbi:MAG: glycosyltransferase family 4 protein [Candidatus Latescibacteria bacterium]|nr:glycosyltransferase family 4 protein [Candidatus Latescibacterota bacterium]
MKIAIDALPAKSLHHGMGTYIYNLLKNLISFNSGHEFIIYKKPEVFTDLEKDQNQQVQFRNIKKSRNQRVLWEYTTLPKLLQKEQVDIFWGPSNFLPLRKACKYVVTIHDLSSFTYADTYPYLRRKYYQYIIKQAVKRADLIVTDSEFSRQDIVNTFSIPAEEVKVISCGIDDIFQPIDCSDKHTQIKSKYKLPDDFIFTLGVIEPKKNTQRLVQAYTQLKNKHVDLPKLVVGGSKKYGWKNRRIFQLVDELKLKDSVIFTGFIEHQDLPVIYSTAKLFILPSLFEGFGLPVIEAMACGTPVITSNTSSLPEIAGDAAVLINPYDTEEIGQAIIKVISDQQLQTEMRAKGFKNVKRFSWQESAHELLDVFEQIGKK